LMDTVKARLPRDMIEALETLAKEEQINRSEIIRRTLAIGIRELLMERALKSYRERRVSLWKAAQMAQVSLREMIEAADKALIPIYYDTEDLERDLVLVGRKSRSR